MTDRTQHKDETDDPKRPSQAEGDRETVEQDLGERDKGGRQETHRPPQGQHDRSNDPARPSKPEGERAADE